jgi:raffinose/stachyose/melibiose transport system permease protein
MQRSYAAYALIGPALLFYLAFVGFPILQVIAYSLFNWDSGTITGFGGATNYVRLFSDPVFWIALGHNVIWVILTLIFPLAVGLFLAAVLAESGPNTRRIFSAVYFLPRTIPLVVSGVIWSWIYNPIFGLLNWCLKGIGLRRYAGAWLAEPDSALLSLNVVGAWTFFGFCAVIYLSAMQSIDPGLYEAAQVDGASWWQRFRLITVPMLKSTSLFLGLYAAIEAMRFFDLVWVTTSGGPGYSTEILTTQIYKSFFLIGDFGYASALSVVLLAIVLSIGTFAFWQLRER